MNSSTSKLTFEIECNMMLTFSVRGFSNSAEIKLKAFKLISYMIQKLSML